ncbi:unnamed protein product [Microthlaspi erraticum]|uniref:Uncharacterized protein n=1 Tax=Microthlaspi erraticum TaxID=1685480 RepID=A0A6D2JD90_9BRAS|nr:unnamed protein product [Microthlaspi erraticum]
MASHCCLSILGNGNAAQMFERIFDRSLSKEVVAEAFGEDNELRNEVMKIIIACFYCSTHHYTIRWRMPFVVWMLGEFSAALPNLDDGVRVIERSLGELPLPDPLPTKFSWFEECRRLIVQGDEAEIKQEIISTLTILKQFPPPPENLPFCCISLAGGNTGKAGQMFHNIFRGNSSICDVVKAFYEDEQLRKDVLRMIMVSFYCPTHHDFIKERMRFVIWILDAFAKSFAEMEDAITVIKRSLGDVPFPKDPAESKWFEHCRSMVYMEREAEIQAEIATLLTNLYWRLDPSKLDPNPQLVYYGLKQKFSVVRTSIVRVLAALSHLPKPQEYHDFDDEYIAARIKKCMMSFLDKDPALFRNYIWSSMDMVSNCTTKLEEDEQKLLDDENSHYWDILRLGLGNFSPPWDLRRKGPDW